MTLDSMTYKRAFDLSNVLLNSLFKDFLQVCLGVRSFYFWCSLEYSSCRMARPLRIEYDGALYHVTSRGNERKMIFKHDGDRKLFVDTLAQVNKRSTFACIASSRESVEHPVNMAAARIKRTVFIEYSSLIPVNSPSSALSTDNDEHGTREIFYTGLLTQEELRRTPGYIFQPAGAKTPRSMKANSRSVENRGHFDILSYQLTRHSRIGGRV